MKIACLNCGRPYPDSGAPYRCPQCEGLFDEVEPSRWHGADATSGGIWRYVGEMLPPKDRITLGEGNTPLVAARAFDRLVHFKCEYANPTGSFKDRGSAAIVSFLVARGVSEAVEDSSGNAGASFAAYAARAGMKASVYVPESASGPKRRQIEMYGAAIVTVPGPRSRASDAVRSIADSGAVYASHAYLPHNLAGYSTCAFEIVEQLGDAPGAIVAPAGQGGLLLGMGRGFQMLQAARVIEKMPMMVGVQAAVCAPLAVLSGVGITGLALVTEAPSLAEGVLVRTPVRAQAVVALVRASEGRFIAVDEDLILPGRDALAGLGFYVEPTSAIVWPALQAFIAELPDPVVVVLTGSGCKSGV